MDASGREKPHKTANRQRRTAAPLRNSLRKELRMSEPDLLYGVDAIAKHLGLTVRQVKHRHENGELPTFKQGRTVCARRSALARYFAEQEQATKPGGGLSE